MLRRKIQLETVGLRLRFGVGWKGLATSIARLCKEDMIYRWQAYAIGRCCFVQRMPRDAIRQHKKWGARTPTLTVRNENESYDIVTDYE